MSGNRSEILIEKLLNNEISLEELDELLQGLSDEEKKAEYSFILQKYFERLVDESKQKE